MDDVTRYVSITYLVGGLILLWFFVRVAAVALQVAGPSADTLLVPGVRLSMAIGAGIALASTLYLWRDQRSHDFTTQCVDELTKVTWPKWDETREQTVVVIIFAVIVSVCLALFDMVFKWLTGLIL